MSCLICKYSYVCSREKHLHTLTQPCQIYTPGAPIDFEPIPTGDCQSCGLRRALGNKAKGVKIPHGAGKCIRRKGLCK